MFDELLVSERQLVLEDLVAQVDYGKMFEGYIPSTYALRVVNTIKLINGEMGEENKTPLIHFHMLDQIYMTHNTLNVAARGTAKTTLSKYIVFDAAIFGDIPNFCDVSFIVYASDTAENGVKTFFTGLKFTWENSPFLQHYLPNPRFTQDECELTNIAGHKLFIKGVGVGTGVRGLTRYGKRPQFAILDDLFTDKNAESPTVVRDIENIIYKAIEQALHPTQRKILWTGTPFNKKDPLYKAAGSDAWHTSVYPICNRFPVSKEEFVGAWEDRFTYESINKTYLKLKEMGKEDGFNQELMLRIMSNEDKLVNSEDLVWYSRDKLLENKHHYNWYITTDYATSEKESADYSATMVWAYNHNGDWMLVDGYLERVDMSVNIKRLFEYVKNYEPVTEVGVEVTGQQRGFISWIKQSMVDKSCYFMLASDRKSGEEGIRPFSNKLVRFNGILPMFKAKKVWFPNELKNTKFMNEVIEEVTNITKSGIKAAHDDAIDCISMLGQLVPWKPSPTSSNTKTDTSIYKEFRPWESTGTSSSYIV